MCEGRRGVVERVGLAARRKGRDVRKAGVNIFA